MKINLLSRETLLSTILLLCLSLQAQYSTESKKAIKQYELGLSAYRQMEFKLAEASFLEAIKQDSSFFEAYMLLAEMYWDTKRYKEASVYIGLGLKINAERFPRGFVNKGLIELSIPDYEAAIISFQDYLNREVRVPKDSIEAVRGIKRAKFSISAMKNPVPFNPINLGTNINTADDEYWPSLSIDENTLVITRRVGSGMEGVRVQEDFFISRFNNGLWGMAKNIGPPVNTPTNEGAQSISADGNTLVYTICNRAGVGRCDLVISYKTKRGWTRPRTMGAPINTKYKETQPSLSPDGRTIYYACDRPGGKGGLDIWKSTMKEDSTWTEPVNLGDSVNGPKDQMAPFIHHDGVSLYFASEYHLGLGGFDIFKAKQDSNGNFNVVENLGYPINTHRDEFGLIINAKGDMAYYASDMQPENRRDIYRFEMPQEIRPIPASYFKGIVYDIKTNRRLQANFELIDINTGDLVQKSISNKERGEFLLTLPSSRNYLLNVSKDGYLFYSDNFSFEGLHDVTDPFVKDIPLSPIIVGERIILKNVFFDTDSHTLKPESKIELDKIVNFLLLNKGLNVEIGGHTDNVGTEAHNKVLSENRAQEVVDYLVNNGIDVERVSYKGYGFSEPISDNTTKEGRAKNRRTELKIMD